MIATTVGARTVLPERIARGEGIVGGEGWLDQECGVRAGSGFLVGAFVPERSTRMRKVRSA